MADPRSPLFLFMRKLHKWLGLVIGLQLLIWLLSGLLMSVINQGVAGGGDSQASGGPDLPLGQYGDLVAPHTLSLPQREIVELRLSSLLGAPVYRVTLAEQVLLFDAMTGAKLSIDAERARQIAIASYGGDGKPVGQQWLAEGADDLKPIPGPLWKVEFDGTLATRVYVNGRDGSVIAHRNSRSSLMEFLLMLHFMDYLQQDSFNNPQIIVFGFGALWLSISGLSLLLVSFNRGAFRRRSR